MSSGGSQPWWSLPALPPDAVVPSDAMGYLGGTSHVTPAGDFVWSLRLWTPPSRDTAQPDLSISYSARGGNGILGVGFGLSGLPEIRRCGRTMATHGEVRGISYSTDDRFCLDGAPLVLIGGIYGEDGSEYRTERDGLDKIVFYEGTGAFSPSFFEVWAKDGRIIRYESLKAFRAEVAPTEPYTISPANLVDVVWPVSEVRNRSGDRVVYHHIILPSSDPFAIEYWLDRIEYPLRPGEETGKREIKLLHENRPDPSFTWISGVSFRTTRRLKAIEMYAPNPIAKEIVQRYEFAYLKSASTERSLLQSITRCDGDNACLWSKQFEWENSYRPDFAEPIELDAVEYDDFFFLSQFDSGIQVLDTDGDGRDEILYRIGAEYFLRRMNGSGTPLGERIWIDPVATAPAPGTFGFHDIFVNQSRA
ncbi:MAG: hypothetical protein HUU21_34425, partial [Polyangiaceae bacterium]|nr:hypothetical protein [Polyangiaceae bacterium]